MTHEQATTLLAALSSEQRVEAVIVAVKTRGAVVQHHALRVLLKSTQRVILLRQPDQWPSVREAWDLSA